MKKALLAAALLSQLLIVAQDNWGKINFKTLQIPKADGSGTYSVPLRDYDGGAGLGARPQGAFIGLFLPGAFTPFATSGMGTSGSLSPYAVYPASQTVAVPGYAPGSRPVIIIRAWIGSSWQTFFGTPLGEWIFTTLPLGGIPPDGGPEIPTPSLTGWGPEDSSGISVTPWPPSAHVSGPAQGAVFAAPAMVQIGASYGGDPGCTATNLAIYAGPIVVASLVGDEVPSQGPGRAYLTPPLGPGAYSIYSVVDAGYGPNGEFPQFLFTGRTQSIPIDITVVDPIDITLTSPIIANGQLSFQYTANSGLSYAIQSSTNFKDWQTIATMKPTLSPATFTQPITNPDATFYRVERLPNP